MTEKSASLFQERILINLFHTLYFRCMGTALIFASDVCGLALGRYLCSLLKEVNEWVDHIQLNINRVTDSSHNYLTFSIFLIFILFYTCLSRSFKRSFVKIFKKCMQIQPMYILHVNRRTSIFSTEIVCTHELENLAWWLFCNKTEEKDNKDRITNFTSFVDFAHGIGQTLTYLHMHSLTHTFYTFVCTQVFALPLSNILHCSAF